MTAAIVVLFITVIFIIVIILSLLAKPICPKCGFWIACEECSEKMDKADRGES
jgi:hypothetical protein